MGKAEQPSEQFQTDTTLGREPGLKELAECQDSTSQKGYPNNTPFKGFLGLTACVRQIGVAVVMLQRRHNDLLTLSASWDTF